MPHHNELHIEHSIKSAKKKGEQVINNSHTCHTRDPIPPLASRLSESRIVVPARTARCPSKHMLPAKTMITTAQSKKKWR